MNWTKQEMDAYKKRLINTDSDIFKLLIDAHNIRYFAFYYSIERWNKQFDRDFMPLVAHGYLKLKEVKPGLNPYGYTNLCALTEKALKHLDAYSAQIKGNWKAIGL